jgi:diguanylate cyclase (GGDEF)-like protein
VPIHFYVSRRQRDAQVCRSTLVLRIACGVVLFDLDGFKDINNALGHKVGDLPLCETDRRRTNLAGQKNLVARVSGDNLQSRSYDVDSNC